MAKDTNLVLLLASLCAGLFYCITYIMFLLRRCELIENRLEKIQEKD